ncbi:hypothetical protein [Yinghuangia soli]|uniref:PASTA domain-containing protein n=1 Tax=Yinghuangia soli TaxID=2908204 RepID=A0AA41Q0M6_9ACTN|nr:hypothetical protein [Yinghuangia soli]MCF2527877.1 hypothetical protein [Yinghuangia soli]
MLLVIAALIDRGSCSPRPGGDQAGPAAGTAPAGAAGQEGPGGTPTGAGSAPAPAPKTTPAPAKTSAAPQPAPTATDGVPQVVGKDLQKARDAVWMAGYHFIKPHDALGRGRTQLLLSNWQVCDQNPGPGKVDKDTTVRLGVVRKDEDCPTTPMPTTKPSAPDGITPDVLGRSVNVVRQALRSEVKVDADDLKSGRPIIIENHWQVCTQNPAPGAPLPKDKIRLGVVKFGEKCP